MPKARYDSYIICTSPRSGSTLLCKLLSATKVAGEPGSHFHKPALSSWLQTYQLDNIDFESERDALSAIFKSALKRGTGDTGMFGLRLQRGSFDFFMQQIAVLYPKATGDVGRIRAAFGRTFFIHLTRSNKLDQAISLIKASQTGLWHKAPDGTELERLKAPQQPFYDAEEIARELASLKAMDEAWQDWFDQKELRPLRISYDDLSKAPNGTLEVILAELGLDRVLGQGIETPVSKLADATSQEWADRFRREFPPDE